MKKYMAEMIGTFWLVFGGCGSAVFAAGVNLGIGYLGVSLAFGLTVLTMAYTIGRISGCHINPAVSVGLYCAGRFNGRDVPFYVIAQVIGGVLAAGFLLFILQQQSGGYDIVAKGLAANGYGNLSPEKYGLSAAFLIEFVLTFFFLLIILASTSRVSTPGFAPIPIGLSLVLIHLVSIPVTNTSVNPARSFGPALFVGGEALQQVWLFWAAPILGAVAASFVWRYFESE